VDFDTDSLVDVNQLVSDLASGQFSFEPLAPNIIPAIPEEPLVSTPYESPQWLASFMQDFLAHTTSILPHTEQTSDNMDHIPDINRPVSMFLQPLFTSQIIISSHWCRPVTLLKTF
jgi:hypothetical protein